VWEFYALAFRDYVIFFMLWSRLIGFEWEKNGAKVERSYDQLYGIITVTIRGVVRNGKGTYRVSIT
jgi:hypothetical protein